MPQAPNPTILDGRHVRLEPLAESHVPALFRAAGRDEEVWCWLTAPTLQTETDRREILSRRLRDVTTRKRVPFVVLSQAEGTAIGTTDLHSGHRDDGRIEIGGTWFGRNWRRTAANTETKILTMTYAFEKLA